MVSNVHGIRERMVIGRPVGIVRSRHRICVVTMITFSTLWFINKLIQQDYEVNGNVGCLIAITGMIDTVMVATVVWLVVR